MKWRLFRTLKPDYTKGIEDDTKIGSVRVALRQLVV